MNLPKRIKPMALAGMAWILPAVAGAAVLEPSALWDASQDSDSLWDVIVPDAGNQARLGNLDWQLNGVSHMSVTSDYDLLSDAYVWGAGDTGVTPSFDFIGGPDPTENDVTFEFYIKPGDLDAANTEVIFEAGGAGHGSSLVLEGDRLRYTVKRAGDSATVVSASLQGLTDTGGMFDDFIQATTVFDITNNNIALYVNGLNGSLQINDSAGGTTDWSGADDAGLGSKGDKSVGASGGAAGDLEGYDSFEGQIALIRFYEQALTEAQVTENFESTRGDVDPGPGPDPSIPLPGVVWLYALGLLMLAGMRQRRGLSRAAWSSAGRA